MNNAPLEFYSNNELYEAHRFYKAEPNNQQGIALCNLIEAELANRMTATHSEPEYKEICNWLIKIK